VKKHILIIGAGVAGLTAGIYAKRSGFDVTLVEQHSISGGMCTAWRRKGYLFDGAMHWLTGSSPKTEMYQVWRDLGAISDEVPLFHHEPFRSVEWDGETINLYRDIDKTAEHLSSVSPEDAPQIRQLVKDVRALSNLQMPIFDIKGVKAKNPKSMSLGFLFKLLPTMPTMKRLDKITCHEYATGFTHSGIQRLLHVVPGNFSATSSIVTLATLNAGDGGYPEGGALAMANRMEKTFTDLGGNLRLNTKVKRVKMKDGVATGVTLADDTVLDADAVIIAQETIAALKHLFDIPPQDTWLKELSANAKTQTCTFISIGVRTKLPKTFLPEWKLDTPITYAGETVETLSFHSYAEYADYAPEGGTALTTAFLHDTYDFWKQAKDEGRYQEEKKALAEQISHALCEKYPQAAGKIEVIDVATPLTYERYTGAYHGAWMTEVGPKDKMARYPGTVEGVRGLYFAGHRLMAPGGLPAAAVSGRQAAQLVCKQFDHEFC